MAPTDCHDWNISTPDDIFQLIERPHVKFIERIPKTAKDNRFWSEFIDQSARYLGIVQDKTWFPTHFFKASLYIETIATPVIGFIAGSYNNIDDHLLIQRS